MKTIFSGKYIETMNIRNILENEKIEVFLMNENMSTLEPWVVSPGGQKPLILQVNEDDFENAERILKDYESGKLEI
jgi:hypothetical protein